jgi:hypothetical protein
MATADRIDTEQSLKEIETLGYVPSTIREGDAVVLVAEPTISGDHSGRTRLRQMVRLDGHGEEYLRRAAQKLASHCKMPATLSIPTRVEPFIVEISPGSSVVLIGANGAGKTRLGVMLESTLFRTPCSL